MTTHPEHDDLLALVDAELSAHEAIEVARHVASCATCSSVMTELRASAGAFANVLYALDSAEPESWAFSGEDDTANLVPSGQRDENEASVESAASSVHPSIVHPSGDVLPLHPRAKRAGSSRSVSSSGRRLRGADAIRWAAGILLVTGAAASAAIVATRMLSSEDGPTVSTIEPTAAEPRVAAVMGAPVNGAIRIAIGSAGADSRLIVRFEDRPDVRVAVEGEGAPRFTAVPGRVDVNLGGASVTLRLTLPRDLRNVTVTAEDGTVVTVQNQSVVPAEAADGGVPITMPNTE